MSIPPNVRVLADSSPLSSIISGSRTLIQALSNIPEGFIAVLARFSIAATFWKSGQTKVEGFAIDIVEGRFTLGIPKFAESTIELFRDEYQLPSIPPELAAVIATAAEHVFPLLLLLGLATRASALALLTMTIVIQLFVYPAAYPIHGVWATALLFLIAKGPGALSLDRLITRKIVGDGPSFGSAN